MFVFITKIFHPKVFCLSEQSAFTLCQYPLGNDIFKSMFQRGSDINSGKFIVKAVCFPRNTTDCSTSLNNALMIIKSNL